MKRYSSQDTSKSKKSRVSWLGSLYNYFILVLIIVFVFYLSELIVNSFSYLLKVISNDPLAGRNENFVADSIQIILSRYPFFGIGFVIAEEFSQTATIGLWDSLIFYDLYFYGLIGMVLKGFLFAKVFSQAARGKSELAILSIMLLNLYVAGLGLPVFGQERIGDFLWIFIGFEWTRSRLYSLGNAKSILHC